MNDFEPQNRSTQKETSHLKINQHKRDLSLRSHKTQKETSYLKIIQYKKKPGEMFLFVLNDFEVRGLFLF
jgi:hypothetical protein